MCACVLECVCSIFALHVCSPHLGLHFHVDGLHPPILISAHWVTRIGGSDNCCGDSTQQLLWWRIPDQRLRSTGAGFTRSWRDVVLLSHCQTRADPPPVHPHIILPGTLSRNGGIQLHYFYWDFVLLLSFTAEMILVRWFVSGSRRFNYSWDLWPHQLSCHSIPDCQGCHSTRNLDVLASFCSIAPLIPCNVSHLTALSALLRSAPAFFSC